MFRSIWESISTKRMNREIKAPKNKECTRSFSDTQEKHVALALGGEQTSSSGAGHFSKGDVLVRRAELLVECKTCTKDKESFTIKKEWVEKNLNEGFAMRLPNQCIAFNFGPSSKDNYYVINERLMKFLVEKLENEDND